MEYFEYQNKMSREEIERFMNSENSDSRQCAASWGDDTVRDRLINDSDYLVRRSVAEYGNDFHRSVLANDPEWMVRESVVKYGNDSIRKQLLNDKSPLVRAAVAECGSDSMRDELLNDPSSYVRSKIARYGNDRQRDVLVHDTDSEVLAVVADYGNDHHRDLLITSDSEEVLKNIILRGNQRHREILSESENVNVRIAVAEAGCPENADVQTKLAKDPEWEVRAAVAEYGNDGHRDLLMHDEREEVVKRVAENANIEQCVKLQNNESYWVASAAIERAHELGYATQYSPELKAGRTIIAENPAGKEKKQEQHLPVNRKFRKKDSKRSMKL